MNINQKENLREQRSILLFIELGFGENIEWVGYKEGVELSKKRYLKNVNNFLMKQTIF